MIEPAKSMPRWKPAVARIASTPGIRLCLARRGRTLARASISGSAAGHQYLTLGSMTAAMTSMTKLISATITAMAVTMPCTAMKSSLLEVLRERVADALPLEGRLGEHGAAQQRGDLQAHDGDDRDQRVPERVLAHHPAFGHAARAGGLDVVGAQRLQQVHPDQPQEDAAE